jgi:hypothetical protein
MSYILARDRDAAANRRHWRRVERNARAILEGRVPPHIKPPGRPRKVEVERPSVAVHVADLVDRVIQGVGK